MRLDLYLTNNSLAKSRTFAKLLIDKGFVEVNGVKATKPSLDISIDDIVVLTGTPYDYVSRGGLKLDAAIKSFGIDVTNKKCVDIGASSGGFTDCLLKNGAEIVYAIDSGKDQLDKSLLEDKRVISIESFNARELTDMVTNGKCDIAVCDVSFISQTLIIPVLPQVLKNNGIYISLIKPQFECGKEGLKKGGLVKNNSYLISSIEKVINCVTSYNIGCLGLIKSPITGGDGNVEFLMYCCRDASTAIDSEIIRKVVLSK